MVLADPKFNTPAKVDMLVGAEVFYTILKRQQITVRPSLPIFYETELGYIAAGKFAKDSYEETFSEVSLKTTYEALNKQMHRFWQLEEVNTSTRKFTREEQRCEEAFLENTYRDSDGRFVVRLPMLLPPSTLGDSLPKALASIRSAWSLSWFFFYKRFY